METRILGVLALTAIVMMTAIGTSSAQSSVFAASHDAESEQFILIGTTEGVVHDLATIKFSILSEGEARLDVVDSRGKIVEELVAGEITPGKYTMYYKPSAEIQSGEYFLRMSMNGVTRSERFLVGQ